MERGDAQHVEGEEEDEQHGAGPVISGLCPAGPRYRELPDRPFADCKPEETADEGENAGEDEDQAPGGERDVGDEGGRDDDAGTGEDLIEVHCRQSPSPSMTAANRSTARS